MPRLVLTAVYLFFIAILNAQENLPDFGKVSMSELTMKECFFDKNADAMNLVKTEKITFKTVISNGDPWENIEYWQRIKIFNEKGFGAANIKIPYTAVSGSTKITDIEAYIYNIDSSGQITREKVEKKQIFKQKGKAKIALNEVSFTFKNLQKGSVIEYRYTRVNKKYFIVEPWPFQDELPTAISKVIFAAPTYLRVAFHFVNNDPVKKDSSFKKNGGNFFDENIYSFSMNNIPAFKTEPFMGSIFDNMERVEFDMSPSSRVDKLYSTVDAKWKYYNRQLLRADDFGAAFRKAIPETESFIDSIKKFIKTEDKIAAIYQYVKRRVEWNMHHTFYCDSVENVLTNKSGTSGEMNILLLNLLRKADVQCYPALISTRENGKADETFASLGQFNSVIVLAIDSDNLYTLDCTQKDLSYKMPPLNTLNRKIFIVDAARSKWIFLGDERILMKNMATISATMDSTGIITGESRIVLVGFAKTDELEEQAKNKKENDEESTKGKNDIDLSGNLENLTIDTAYNELNKEENDTLVEKMRFHLSPQNTNDNYFLNPFLFANFRENPFTDSDRFYNVDFGCTQNYSTQIYLKVADNFSIEEFPKTISIRMEDSSVLFRREVYQKNNEILVRIFFTLNNYSFPKEGYKTLKTFFDKVYSLISEEILIKKKST